MCDFALGLLQPLLLIFSVQKASGDWFERVDNSRLRMELGRWIFRFQWPLPQLHPLLGFGIRSHRLSRDLDPKLSDRSLHDLFVLGLLLLGGYKR